MTTIAEIRRRIDRLRERIERPFEVRMRDRLAKLSVGQRARYDAWCRADERTTYEELLECNGPHLDHDIWRVLWGDTIIAVDDTERTASGKYWKALGR